MEKTSNKSDTINEDRLLNRNEAAILLQCNLTTLWRYTRAGLIPHYRVGKKMLFRTSEVLEAIKVKKVK
jgi:excisionase family DNA binding protein